MKFHDAKIVEKARKLRSSGISTKRIAKDLRIGDSTVSRWCFDMIIKNKNRAGEYQKQLCQTIEENSGELFKDFVIDKKIARLIISILYHCEGARYPKANFVCFTNSDPKMITLFIKLFRRGFDIDNSKIRIQLQLHTTHNVIQSKKYWSKLLDIREDQIYKPTITEPTNRMKRHDYKGTCSIRYFDFRLLHEIFGIWWQLLECD